MKAKVYKYLFLLLLLPFSLIANEKQKYKKERKINKVFSVNSTAELEVSNKFGSVYVTPWNENKIEIDVVITVNGNNQDLVEKRFNTIDVEFNNTQSLVSAITKFENLSVTKNNNLNFEINYTIKIPKNGSVNVSNQYGDIFLGKINGKTNISCKYGKIIVDELNNSQNNINIQYASGSKINALKNAAIYAKYSDVNLKKGSVLALQSDYTNITIDDIEDIEYQVKYGDIKINNVNKIVGTGNYLNFKIGSVQDILNITTSYSTIGVGRINKNANSIIINSSYTNSNLKYDGNFAFDFEISSKYGNINVDPGLIIESKSDKNNESYYKGYNKKKNAKKISIQGRYGNINLKSL